MDVSIEAMTWALRTPAPTATAKLVLVGLGNFAHADGTCAYPSVQTLATYADTTDRTVQRSLRALEDAKLIRRSAWQPTHLRADRRPVCYDLALSGRHDVAPQDGHGVTPVTERGDASVTQPVHEPGTERETRAEPAPLFEPDPSPPKAPRRKPERPIPDGWQPDGKLREWAAANTPGVDVDHEAGRFVDHALSVDRRARDWPAAFRNWLRKAAERVPRGTASPGPGRRYEGAESHDAGYWTPEGASLLLDEEDGRG